MKSKNLTTLSLTLFLLSAFCLLLSPLMAQQKAATDIGIQAYGSSTTTKTVITKGDDIIKDCGGDINAGSETLIYRIVNEGVTVSRNGGSPELVNVDEVSDWLNIAEVATHFFPGIEIIETGTRLEYMETIFDTPTYTYESSWQYIDGALVETIVITENIVSHDVFCAILELTGEIHSFIPVTNITGIPATAKKGVPLTLNGTVNPENATHKNIIWSVKNAGTTGATITGGNVLNTTKTGTVVVTATIENGLGEGEDYIQEFEITVEDIIIAHPITVLTDGNGTAAADDDEATAGTLITLTATPNEGYEFAMWQVISGDMTISNPTENSATFIMPDNAVEIKATFNLKAGTNEIEAAKIRVYPNPTTGKLRIENGELKMEDVEIYDIYGKKQKAEGRKQKGEGKMEINISHLPSGIYFVKIQTEKGIVTKKVIKN